MKYITIFFDLEGFWEAPYRGSYDEEANVNGLLEILKRYNAKGVFNTCGIVAEFFPNLIKRLAKERHEISTHGYRHENFVQMSSDELNSVLEKTEKIIEKLTGQRIIGARSPWLQHNDMVYEVFRKRGYKWVSNKYVPFPEIFLSPGTKKYLVYNIARMSLKFQHLFYGEEPYMINGLMEIPLTSSLEGDILGIMNYWQNSPQEWLDFAYNSLVKQFNKSKRYFNLNLHPWLIGSGNRPKLLNDILKYITSHEVKFVLAKELINLK